MKLNPNKGFTIIELLVVMIIASIFLLSVGIISIIGIRSYDKYRRESQIYNDISYGFELIKNRVRRTPVAPDTPTGGPWVGKALVVGEDTFGVQQQGCFRDFVYTESSGVTHTIAGDIIPTVNPTFDPTINGKEVKVRLVGRVEVSGNGNCALDEPDEKYESFDLSTDITRRNP